MSEPSEAYREGETAYALGLNIEQNPYRFEDVALASAWNQGWLAASHQDEWDWRELQAQQERDGHDRD